LELLRVLQLSDSFFPTGAYAHSQGLEGMVALGWVSNVEEVREYLADLLTGAILPLNGVALLHAHRSSDVGDVAAIIEIDRLLHAMKLPEEMRRASIQSGRRVLDETHDLLSAGAAPAAFAEYRAALLWGATPGSSAVAFGVSTWAQGIAAETALFGFCHALAVGALGAAQRLLPIGHGEAQAALRSLHGQMVAGVAAIKELHWQDMTSFTPWADIASMRHETADLRMFAS
jgi:urease accessory protein